MINDKLLIDYVNNSHEYKTSNGRKVDYILYYYMIDGINLSVSFEFENDDRRRTVEIDFIKLMNWFYCKMLEK